MPYPTIAQALSEDGMNVVAATGVDAGGHEMHDGAVDAANNATEAIMCASIPQCHSVDHVTTMRFLRPNISICSNSQDAAARSE